MPDMRIGITLPGGTRVASQIGRIGLAAQASAGQVAKLNGSLAASGSSGGGGRAPFVGIPPAQIRATNRLQKQEEKLPPTIGGAVREALLTSRFGFGAGGFSIHPLVNRSLSALRAVGPAAETAGVALAGFALATDLAIRTMNAGLERAAEMGAAATVSGGTVGQVGAFGALGVSPGELAGAARRLRDLQSSDPFAMMAGGPQIPLKLGGNQNLLDNMQRQFEMLRRMGPGEAQLLQARRLELDAYLPLINASEGVWRRARLIAAAEGEIFTPAFLQNARDFGVTQSQMGAAFSDLGASIAKPWAPGFVDGMSKVVDTVEAAAVAFNRIGEGFTQVRSVFAGDWLESIFPNVAGRLHRPFGGGQQDRADANERTAKNTEDLVYLLKQGVYGGGARTRSAVPSEWVGPQMREAMRTDAIRLGAF